MYIVDVFQFITILLLCINSGSLPWVTELANTYGSVYRVWFGLDVRIFVSDAEYLKVKNHNSLIINIALKAFHFRKSYRQTNLSISLLTIDFLTIGWEMVY